ncbi:MAG: HupE/UreJ family protein [Ghiorsea sp.]
MFFKSMKVLLGVMILGLISQVAYAHGMSEADKQAIIDGGNLLYMWIGATHMLSGYDHLAFVFGIIFFLSNFRDIVKYVSAFTVGHSITLIYATFNGIQLNYFLVDAVIALSVCYIAFANIDGFRKYLSVNPPNMMFMILGLGLIHGFGLSTRLQELPLSADSLLMNIISFNVGIELGQITALAVMLLLIAAWRKRHSFKAFSLIANYTLILAGAFLFLMQMHDFSHDGETSNVAVAAEVTSPVLIDEKDVLKDTITVDIPARGEIEYKVMLSKGAVLEYTWKTAGTELFFDFHGDPKDNTAGSFKSYGKGTKSQASGSLTAPFEGNHGWYWQNRSNQPVQVTLDVKGVYQLITKEKEPEQPKLADDLNLGAHDSL